MEYTINDVILLKHQIKTKDGKYYTVEDSRCFSYWHSVDDKYSMGSRAYDYLFACKEGLESAVKLLNRLINEN